MNKNGRRLDKTAAVRLLFFQTIVNRLVVTFAAGDRFHHTIEIEAAGLLSWWKFFKALQPLTDIRARGGDHVHMIRVPLLVAEAFVFCSFKRIAAQVFQHRRTQLDERSLPDIQSMRFLNQEAHFPVAVTKSGHAAVIGPVQELFSRPFRFALQSGDQVVTVKMNLEVFFANLLSLRRSSFAVVFPAAARSVVIMSS